MNIDFSNPMWWASQVFAFFALIFFVWGWQIKDKVKMMTLIGLASISLAASAPFLGNWSLAVLFGLAAIRNFVFAYIDSRAKKGIVYGKWVTYLFATIFAVATITATTLILTVFKDSIKVHSVWLEILICGTLLGLILGNVLAGTHLMRWSFVANRAFNIVNHVFFGNIIAVVIAGLSISSNLVFYLRQIIAYVKKRKNQPITESGQPLAEETANEPILQEPTSVEPLVSETVADLETESK
ncbi:MAG: YgjV family protein [Firmicutes bacterium]|nr:YgjV family protein [Bacillota bacterium]